MKPYQCQWTEKAVAKQFRQAMLTLRKLPTVKIQGYANAWPDIVRQPHEIAYMEPDLIKLHATPDEITQLEEVFDWVRWITVEERKLLWKRAARISWRNLCYELGYCRTTVWHKWKVGLMKIAIKLNSQQIQHQADKLDEFSVVPHNSC